MTQHPFIDVAVMDHVREAIVAGEAVLVLSADLGTILFANAGGMALCGHGSLGEALGGPSNLTPLQMRQIRALHGFPDFPGSRMAILRFSAVPGQAIGLTARRLDLAGDPAILLAGQVPGLRSDPAATARLLGAEGCAAAIVDHEGTIIAASPSMEDLSPDPVGLAAMTADVRNEDDRLVKRPLGTCLGALPAALARLRDDDPLHLLLIVGVDDVAAAENVELPVDITDEAPGLPAADTAVAGAMTDNHDLRREPVVSGPFTDGPLAAAPIGGETPSRALGDETQAIAEDVPALDNAAQDQPARPASPLRFAWKTDETGSFSEISPGFVEALGVSADEIVGHSFADIARRFGMDADGQIAALFMRRDTWSGRQVTWPLADSGLAVPVELAALPTFTRERAFSGFRGFGTARFDDLTRLPDKAAEPDRPASERSSGNVVTFGRRREDDHDGGGKDHQPAAQPSLTPVEVQAFQEIGRRLSEHDTDATGRPDDDVARLDEIAEAMDRPSEPELIEPRDAIAEGFDRLAEERDERSPETAEQDNDEPPADVDVPAADDDQPDRQDMHPVMAANDDGMATSLEPDESQFDLPRAAGEDEPASSAMHDGPRSEHQDGSLDNLRDFAVVDGDSFDELDAPILIHAGDALHYANPAFLRLAGHGSLDAIIEAGGLDKLFADSDDGEGVRLRRADGTTIAVDAHLKSIRWRGGHALLLVLNPAEADSGEDDEPADTAAEDSGFFAAPAMPDAEPTPTGEAEALIAAREARLKIDELNAILDTATDGVVVMDSAGIVRSINASAEALFGHDEAEVVGKPFTALLAIESHRKAEDYLAALEGNGVASVLNDGREMIGRERHGRFIPLFVTIGRLAHSSGYCAVLRDLTHWKQTEDALNSAKRDAEAASSQKTQFLARISHEIRTPLNAIIGFSDLMLAEKFGPLGSPRYRDYLFDIHKSGNLVLQLVNDLLDIAKIEAGEEILAFEAVSVEQVLAEAVSIMQPEANRQRVLVRSSFAPDAPQVVADARSLKQIALNLLSNAIRYTDSGGQVIVSTVYNGETGEHALRIRDTGIGMTSTEIEEALKPYRQVRRPGDRRSGTGLGLPLTKAMAEANKARFKISSTPGVGTIIEIAFPPARVLAG